MYIEKIDNLDVVIDKCFPITNDAIIIAEYILNDNINNKFNMCEIGTGSGYISLKLRNKFSKIIAVDINKESINNLLKNIYNLKIDNIELKNIDINNYVGKFDVIVSNPPFFKMNEGKLPEDSIKLISKFEYRLNLEQLIRKTFDLLNKEGIFYFIYPISRLEEVKILVSKYGLEILDIKIYNKRFIIKGKKY